MGALKFSAGALTAGGWGEEKKGREGEALYRRLEEEGAPPGREYRVWAYRIASS